jgi:hypothetical protein
MSFKFNPFTGNFDIDTKSSGGSTTVGSNFSYTLVDSDIEILNGQEMLLKSALRITSNLLVSGTLRFIKDDVQQMSHWNFIPIEETAIIPQNKSMFYKNNIRLNGTMRIYGKLEAI